MNVTRTTIKKEATKVTDNATHNVVYTTVNNELIECTDSIATAVQKTQADGSTVSTTMLIGSITWQQGTITCNLTNGAMTPFASEFETIITDIKAE